MGDTIKTAEVVNVPGSGSEGDPEESFVETDEETEGVEEAEIEAGSSDTVPRSEMVKAIKARQAAKARLREKEKELAELQRKNETESEAKVRETLEATTKALEGKYKPALIKSATEAALLAAKPKKGKAGIPRLIRLMDLDAIEVTEDLELDGVEDEVARLQEEFPELFGEETTPESGGDSQEKVAPRKRATTSRSADGAGRKTVEKKRSTSEILMAQLRGEG